jgi:hypothetical protein
MARREFLKSLAASPYVAALGGVIAFLEQRGLSEDAQQPLTCTQISVRLYARDPGSVLGNNGPSGKICCTGFWGVLWLDDLLTHG